MRVNIPQPSHWTADWTQGCSLAILRVRAKFRSRVLMCMVHCKKFNHILVTSVAFLLCVWHVKFKKCLQFKQCVVEKLPSLFFKIVSPFRKPINQHFWRDLLFLHIYPWRYPWLCACGRNARIVSQIGLLKKRLANGTKEEAPHSIKKTYMVAFIGHTDATAWDNLKMRLK